MINRDRRCVFVADTPGEAEVVVIWLKNQGIDAQAMSLSTLGDLEGLTLYFGKGASFRGIEVWVKDPDQALEALRLLAEHSARFTTPEVLEDVVAICDECGEESVFPGKQRGTVQNCPHCEAYLDVPSSALGGEEDIGEPEDE